MQAREAKASSQRKKLKSAATICTGKEMSARKEKACMVEEREERAQQDSEERK